MRLLKKMLPLGAAAMLAAPAAAQADVMHTVTPGESLTSIAEIDGLTVDQLAAANGISPNSWLIAGSTIAIPPQGAPVSGPATNSTAGGATGGTYLVRPGDTLTAIAARAGTTVDTLSALNGLNPKNYLLYGTVLRLPGAGAVPSGSVASSQPVGNASVGPSSAPPYPTPQRMTAGQIGAIAQANGVPPALADGIAWQESGFNNDAVSPAGARGVMQIMPGTWTWIEQDLTPDMPLSPDSALDNVRGGVIMLHALLGATGGNEAETAAAYYEGLGAVRRYGMYSDTKQYVRDVMALTRDFGGG